MTKWIIDLGITGLKIISYPFVILIEMSKGVFGHDNPQPHYWRGDTKPITRPESYRTLKRRNRLIRKFDHKKDE
jgi:hypothetical protein